MPLDSDLDANNDSGEMDSEPIASAPPSFNTDQLREAVAAGVREVVAGMNRPQPQRQAPQPMPEPESASDEEFASGDPGQLRMAIGKEIRRALHPLMRDFNQFANVGMERLGSLTREQMAQKLPHYNRYRAEIEQELSTLNPQLRTDPMTIEFVHDRVAMRHEGERMDEIRKEATRQARGDAPAPSGTNGRGKAPAPGVPTPEELGFSSEQVEEIERKGGPDAFARRVSQGRMNDWSDYAAAAGRRAGTPGTRSLRGNIIPFLRGKVQAGVVTEDGDILGRK